MPIFEYKCNDCGYVMEFLEKTRTAHKYKCKKCNSSNLQKQFSCFAIGHSKPVNPICRSCPDGSCQTDTCPYN